MKVKAKMKKDMAVVKLLAKHPMETGLRKDKKTGELIPAKFIQELVAKYNDKVVFTANLGRAVSKNPYISFAFAGAEKGGTLVISWLDNTGETLEVTEEIK